jgi:hypothetical protein
MVLSFFINIVLFTIAPYKVNISSFLFLIARMIVERAITMEKYRKEATNPVQTQDFKRGGG